MINRRMKLKGGKFLGQGTYGCVFFPSKKCRFQLEQKQSFDKAVSKVFSDKRDMKDEIVENNKIKKMDKNGLYTNKALGNCELSINEFDVDETTQCRHLSTSNSDNTSKYQILYEHKGVDLKGFMKNPYSLSSTFNYLLNLMKGIQLLVKHYYVHLDLKPENILISDSNKALLIDFGLGRSFNSLYNIDNSDYLLKYNYIWYPPEFNFFYELQTSKAAPEYILDAVIGFNYYKYNSDFPKYTEDNVTNQLTEFYKTLNNTGMAYNPNYFIDNFAHKTDVFSMGMVMFYLHKFAQKDTDFQKYSKRFSNIMNKANALNPYKRATIDELINDVESLINSSSVSKNSLSSRYNNSIKMNLFKPNNNLIKPTLSSKSDVFYTAANIKTSSSKNTKLNNCMQYKKVELMAMVDKFNLPKKMKQLNKNSLCKQLVPYIEQGKSKQTITHDYCMKYYTYNELKQEVTNQNLPPKLKQLNKQSLCTKLLPYLKEKHNPTTIRRNLYKNY